MKRLLTATVVGLMCLGGTAGAQSARTPAADVVEARQAAMMLSGVAMGSIKAAVDAGQPIASQRFATRALARWAHAVPGAFPTGSGAEAGVRTTAKPQVRSHRARLAGQAAPYRPPPRRPRRLDRRRAPPRLSPPPGRCPARAPPWRAPDARIEMAHHRPLVTW